jgi:hypothetical protein
MTDSKQPDGDEPKKKSLKLLLRSKPVAEVETSIGRIYLYPIRVFEANLFCISHIMTDTRYRLNSGTTPPSKAVFSGTPLPSTG